MSDRVESYEAAMRLLNGRQSVLTMLTSDGYQARVWADRGRQSVTLQYRQAGDWNAGLRLRPAQPAELIPLCPEDGNLAWVLNRVGPSRMKISGRRAEYRLETAAGEQAPLVAGLMVAHDGSLGASASALQRLALMDDFGTLLREELAWQRWDDGLDDLTLLAVPASYDEAQRVGFYGQVSDRIRSLTRRQAHLDLWEPEGWWKGTQEDALRAQSQKAADLAHQQLHVSSSAYLSYSDLQTIRAEVAHRAAESRERARQSESFWGQIAAGRVA